MQYSIKYLIAVSVVFSVAQVEADDTAIPQRRLRSNPIPAQSTVDEEDTEIIDLGSEETISETTTETSEVAIAPAEPAEPISSEEPKATSVTSSERVDPNAPIEVVEERYDSGNVKIRREMTLDLEGNYVKHGQWTMISEAGDEVASGKYVVNQREGAWKKTINWGETPLLNELPYPEFEAPFVSEAEFSQGKLDGTWSITDHQGRVASQWLYSDGKLNGPAKWYYPDGTIREQIDYTYGLLNGNWKLVDADGTELENSTYQQGRKLASKQEAYDNGVLRWEGMFLHETSVPNSPDDWWKTKPVAYKTVGEPERHGEFTSWYENGQKKFAGTFEHEVRTGEFTWWHENTQVAVKGLFVDGERDGLWVWWHENGQKAIRGNYANGKLEGDWSYWNAEGKLDRKVDYSAESNPIATHSVPTTDIRTKNKVAQKVKTQSFAPRANVADPVGTGVRVANKATARAVRRNPVRK